MTPQMKTLFCGLYLLTPVLGLSVVQPDAAANEFYSMNLSLGEESNVPRGLDSVHELGSVFSQIQFAAGKLLQLGLNDSVTLSGTASYTRFEELRGFDIAEFGAGISLRHKFGFGALAPTVSLSSSYVIANSGGSARDRNSATIELSASKQFASGFAVSMGMDYLNNTTDSLPNDPAVDAFGYDPIIGAPFELFDFSATSAFLNADYTFYNAWILSAGYRRINGATVASTTTPSLAVYKISDAFYTDPAFESDSNARWFAYQLETNTDQFSTAISFPVLVDTSIDLSASWNDIRAASGRNYDNTIYAITLNHNF